MTFEEFKLMSFDDLVNLCNDDPEKFESETREMIMNYISEHVPEDRKLKLEQFQWKLDGELRKYKDPVARLNKMVELFWKGVNEFQTTLKEAGFNKTE